jgi:hypothetical protein
MGFCFYCQLIIAVTFNGLIYLKSFERKWCCVVFSSTFRRKKVELLSSLWRQHLGQLSFLSRVHFSKTIKGIHLKLGILVHYQKRNQLQQGR